MKRKRKILYIMILGIIAICFSKFPLGKKVSATMADEEIIVQTEYGYDSYAKFGRYMPITAKVSSKHCSRTDRRSKYVNTSNWRLCNY